MTHTIKTPVIVEVSLDGGGFLSGTEIHDPSARILVENASVEHSLPGDFPMDVTLQSDGRKSWTSGHGIGDSWTGDKRALFGAVVKPKQDVDSAQITIQVSGRTSANRELIRKSIAREVKVESPPNGQFGRRQLIAAARQRSRLARYFSKLLASKTPDPDVNQQLREALLSVSLGSLQMYADTAFGSIVGISTPASYLYEGYSLHFNSPFEYIYKKSAPSNPQSIDIENVTKFAPPFFSDLLSGANQLSKAYIEDITFLGETVEDERGAVLLLTQSIADAATEELHEWESENDERALQLLANQLYMLNGSDKESSQKLFNSNAAELTNQFENLVEGEAVEDRFNMYDANSDAPIVNESWFINRFNESSYPKERKDLNQKLLYLREVGENNPDVSQEYLSVIHSMQGVFKGETNRVADLFAYAQAQGEVPTKTETPTATLTPTPTPTPTESDQPESTKFYPEDGARNDWFGYSVGVSDDGELAVIGTWGDDPNGKRSGSAYVFSRSGGTWNQQQKLAANDGDGGDLFGSSVGVSGDGTTVLIGAPGDEDREGGGSGSVYVFSHTGKSWTQESKLIPKESDDSDPFGTSVELSEDGATALVGAAFSPENHNYEGVGAAYVFSHTGGTWNEQTKLSANDGDDGDNFGFSVGLSGDGTTALIGAPSDEDPNGGTAGSAYVFSRTGRTWTQETKLVPDDGDPQDKFGRSVEMARDGATALIGASNDEDPNGGGAGSAYVFSRTEGSWIQQAKLAASDGVTDDRFGVSTRIANGGMTALVGAQGGGSAYMYSQSEGDWSRKIKLMPTDGDEDFFGWSLGLSRDATTALVGAPYDGDPNGLRSGSVYAFDM